MVDMTPIAQAVIALLSVIITTVLIPYILAKTTAVQQAKFQVWVNIAVRAAEQIYSATGTGDIKKKFALNFLGKRGITYNSAVVNAAIEAAVKQLNITQDIASTAAAPEAETVVAKPPGVDTDMLSGKYII